MTPTVEHSNHIQHINTMFNSQLRDEGASLLTRIASNSNMSLAEQNQFINSVGEISKYGNTKFSENDKSYFISKITEKWDTEKFGEIPDTLSNTNYDENKISQDAINLVNSVESIFEQFGNKLSMSKINDSENGKLKEDLSNWFTKACIDQFGDTDYSSRSVDGSNCDGYPFGDIRQSESDGSDSFLSSTSSNSNKVYNGGSSSGFTGRLDSYITPSTVVAVAA
ncbi:uncharacterized protein I206_104608 [Kwoniella pini CBS 10737]|uniref:Uncharacterized protein n=1 Tax=Kwoniella pini CBS 10737 TaxID=1296096 RepID=A0A1B9I7D7_9TREE|nr:uncharacterized protein I206_02142 [Kwoniella pini CBS 10737]OCF51428.1 hypothetical protein I206_02142 [Kwoniella pini CBS 10737]